MPPEVTSPELTLASQATADTPIISDVVAPGDAQAMSDALAALGAETDAVARAQAANPALQTWHTVETNIGLACQRCYWDVKMGPDGIMPQAPKKGPDGKPVVPPAVVDCILARIYNQGNRPGARRDQLLQIATPDFIFSHLANEDALPTLTSDAG